MEVNQYTCKKCDYSVDHPIDACPVCGAIFYWLVRLKKPLSESLKQSYLEEMTELMHGHLDSNYLFHGGKVWLPHAFWHQNPTGQPLNQFSWIQDLQFVQYKKSAGKTIAQNALEETDSNSYKTNPRLSILDKAPAERVVSLVKSDVGVATGWHRLILSFQHQIGVGLFMVFLALAYFLICLGSQNNLKNDQKTNLPSISQSSVNEDLKQ